MRRLIPLLTPLLLVACDQSTIHATRPTAYRSTDYYYDKSGHFGPVETDHVSTGITIGGSSNRPAPPPPIDRRRQPRPFDPDVNPRFR